MTATPSREAAILPDATVADVMHAGVVSCPPQTPLVEVARIMAERRIHHVVVHGLARGRRGAEELVWGAVTDRDLIAAAAQDGRGSAGEIATTELLAISPTDPLVEAARVLAENDASHLIVVDASGAPVGIVSTLDIAGVIAAQATAATS